MQMPDLINGLFEAFGGFSVWLNVRAILRDRKSRGVSKIACGFFTAWGFWNLFYYPHLGQWLSFAGGVIIVVGNTVWIINLWRFRKS
jgi:hypothetical protein